MKQGEAILCLILSSILLSCHDVSRHEATLQWADSLNRSYIPITTDSQLVEAAEFYDRHGISNERMRAHYLLGCAYRDMGEAPKALECYHDAIDCADTLDKDCDYAALFRVYSQMGELFYNQEDCHDCLNSYGQASRYAMMVGDTVQSIVNRYLCSNAYDKLNMPDSSLHIRLETSKAFDRIHQQELSAQVLGGVFATLIERRQLNMARHYMQKYENCSGYFDSYGEIEKGREIYYFYKGLYYLHVDSLTDAYSFFQKITRDTADINNKQAYYKGMQEYYKKLGNIHMYAKYAGLYADATDSTYLRKSMEKMYETQAAYVYGRNERIALLKTQESIRQKNMLYLSLFVAAGLVILLGLIYVRWKGQKRETAMIRRKYSSDICNLSQSAKELSQLISDKEAKIGELILQKEAEVRKYQREIATSLENNKWNKKRTDRHLAQSDISKKLARSARNVAKYTPTATDWQELKELIRREIPDFFILLNEDLYNISEVDMRICMLVRLDFQPKDIASVVGCSMQKVANTRKRLQKRILGEDKGTQYFDKAIKSIY